MEKDSGGHNKKCPTCICVWKPHFRQFVHKAPEGKSHEDNKDEYDVSQYAFEGLHNFLNVDDFHKKVQEYKEEGNDENKVDNGKYFEFESLLLDNANIFPKDFFGLWSLLAVHPKLLLIVVTDKHVKDFPS